MPFRPMLLLLIVSVLNAAVPIHAADAPQPGTQQAEQVTALVPVSLSYLLYLPRDYEKQDKWPLLLFLHGSGERGDDIERVKVHGPPRLIAAGKEFPLIVVSPQCPELRTWHPLELKALLDDLVQRYKVDQDRIYLTGLSMGGSGTWMLAMNFPERFAAIAPICGRGDPDGAKRIAHLPIRVFHGAKDEAVPLEYSQKMVDALQKIDADVQLTVYPEAEHDSWTETYDNPGFYEWLLEHKRQAD
jgi:predicted peptidase